MAMSVFERTREIGILRAVGWRTWRIGAMIVSEAIGICLLALGVGCALGVVAAQLFVQRSALDALIDPDYTAGDVRLGARLRARRGPDRRALPDVARGQAVADRGAAARVSASRMTPSRRRSVAIGARGDRVVVRHEQDRHAALRAQLLEQLEHLSPGRRVERPGRLVGQQQPRLVRERAGDRDPLALAARQHRRLRARAARQPDLGQQLARPAPPARARGRRPNMASWTFSDAVSVGSRLCAWKTKPTTSAR